jgi:hypothetical protein
MDATSGIFELRTYTPTPGKLEALEARFRDHTIGLFARHGLEVIGFWRSAVPNEEQQLIYVLRFPSREAATIAWEEFRADPDWIEARANSEVDGSLTMNIESVFMEATDFSPLT